MIAEKDPVQCLEHHSSDKNFCNNKESPAVPSSSDNVASQPAKRPTRQWAAWTREEEESFFTALRQVGKNFEKITCRVQSKNKDQVRHYYYRLVRRMNKLLGPDLSLDAKNSKDTNAAMLRWWSLLEKYSCKASKLHLKPRRFKIFVETLEHQLMKDRKKNVKKRLVQGENHSSPSATNANQNKMSGNDACGVKVVVDSQNVQKTGQGRGSSSKRNANIGVMRSSYKGESSHLKPIRQRRKSAAMKRWEKAAMAGVSLVADAAEHLERAADQFNCTEKIDSNPSVQVQANSSTLSKGIAFVDNLQATVKLKLQLFPIDESTRKALEMDKHNPHLELTLSSRKKISSILEHLDRKWGTSSAASGDLMIFPFSIQRENLSRYQRWNRDSLVTASEVYAMIGSPPVFRLRYGWICSNELQSGNSQTVSGALIDSNEQEDRRRQTLTEQLLPPTEQKDKLEKFVNHILSNHQTSNRDNNTLQLSTAAISGEVTKNVDVDLHNGVLEVQNLGSSALLNRNEACDESTIMHVEKVVNQRASKSPSSSSKDWVDDLTNIATRKINTEISDVMDANCVETSDFRSSHCLDQIPFTCDSFDAAIAAHISSHHKMGFTEPSPQLSSIWDAEETCDAFSFRNRTVSNNQALCSATAATSVSGPGPCRSSSLGTNAIVQDAEDPTAVKNALEDPMDECPSETRGTESCAKDFSSLTDIYWPDSLGPLELDVPTCKYYSEDLILSDSMSGLNRLLASSLDAFQNCPLFGLDEKGPPSAAAEAQVGASFAGKISTNDQAGVPYLEV